MPNPTEDDSIMVGMDQCRISSVDSNASSTDPLMDGGSKGSGQKSTRVTPFYSQKSRGSHSSGCSCSTGHDDCCGAGATEQEPLIPKTNDKRDSEDNLDVISEAHVNQLHFELFEPCREGVEEQKQIDVDLKLIDTETGLLEINRKTTSLDMLSVNAPDVVDNLKKNDEVVVNEESEVKRTKAEHVRLKHGSKDTVCSSSSSSTTATAMATPTHSSDKSSKQNGCGKSGERKSNNREKRLRHLSTDTDDTSDISATLEPPDGGWGWVVVAASFLVNCIADGVTFSFGVFFHEFTNYFKESESTTAWIGSLLAAIPLLSGPIASSAVDRYGCRNVTVAGGLLAAIGFVLSSYCTSIYVLMMTFGVITGIGLSLCYVAAVVIVAYYFERRRSLATGLSVCGGGIGTFLFAPISQYLIDGYGWQKTLQILAGAFLLLCLCGLLMKDLEWTKKKNRGANNNNSNGSHHHYTLPYHGCNGNTPPCHHHHHHHCSAEKTNSTFGNGKSGNRRCNSAICIPTFVQEQERRERRQRYYSCNQDYDATQPLKDPPSIDLPSSRKSSKKGRNNSIKSRIIQSTSKKENQLDPVYVVSDSCSLHQHSHCPDEGLSILGEEQPGSLSPGGVEIPNEKDNLNTRNACCTSVSAVTNNAEIVDFAQNHHQHIISRSGSDGSCSRRIIIAQTEQCSPSNNSWKTLNNNDVSESSNINYVTDRYITPENATTLEGSSSDLLNYHNNIQLPSRNNYDSNNSNVTNLNNNINGQVSSGGLKRDNSGSSRRYLQRNKSHNNSMNSNSPTKDATVAPTSNVAPLTIPTIIIPPGQQQKGGNNYKLDMINSVRFRSVIHRHSLTYRGAVLNLKRYRLRPASSCPDIISVATSTEGRGSFEFVNLIGDVGRWLRSVFEWENLMNTRFLLFILSNLLLYTWYDVPYMYLQYAAVRQGYSEDLGSYLISSIGLFNVVGNIFLGYLGDKEWASATIVYGVCMIICGGTTVLMPYLMEVSYWGLFTICGIFGLTIAANYALTSVILVQVVSLERFANAYGLLLLVQGIGNLVGPPIAGVISDVTETNTWSFLVAGVGIFASSFFVLAPIFHRELQPNDCAASGNINHQAQVGQVGHNDSA